MEARRWPRQEHGQKPAKAMLKTGKSVRISGRSTCRPAQRAGRGLRGGHCGGVSQLSVCDSQHGTGAGCDNYRVHSTTCGPGDGPRQCGSRQQLRRGSRGLCSAWSVPRLGAQRVASQRIACAARRASPRRTALQSRDISGASKPRMRRPTQTGIITEQHGRSRPWPPPVIRKCITTGPTLRDWQRTVEMLRSAGSPRDAASAPCLMPRTRVLTSAV